MQSMMTLISKMSPWLLLAIIDVFVFPSGSSSSVSSLKYTIQEETKPGTVIAHVLIDARLDKELPSGVSNCKLFDMNSPIQSDIVRIKPLTCELFVNSRIDREVLCKTPKCTLQLSVFINAKIWITVTIEIIDINDNSPKFDPTSVVVQFEENSNIGHFAELALATDADVGQNSVHSYSLEPALQLFELVYTPQLTLRLVLSGKLDYEQEMNRQFNTQVVACDQGSPQLCCKLSVTIEVLDVNDNRPTFIICNKSINVMEDTQVGSIVNHVSASDPDSGVNSRLSYDISNIPDNKLALQYFSVNRNSGKIFLSKSLHTIGMPDNFVLTITARDQGSLSLSSECKMILNIIDVNNHAPSVSVKPTLGKYFQVIF